MRFNFTSPAPFNRKQRQSWSALRQLRRAGLLLLIWLGSLSASAQWVLQPFTFGTPDEFAYRFGIVDANNVWAVSYNDNAVVTTVARTTDGGQNWQLRPVSGLAATEEISSVAATSGTVAWVTVINNAGGGHLRKTTDGGQTWARQAGLQLSGHPNFVHFYNANDGVVVADPLNAPVDQFEVFVTSDAGNTWTRVNNVPPSIANEDGVVLAPSVVGNTLWFATDEGRVFKSADKGITWTVSAVLAPAEVYNVAFRDAQNGLVLSVDNRNNLLAHRSTDGGATWQQVQYQGPLRSGGVTGVPGTNLFLSVGGGDLSPADRGSSYSADNGATWVTLENNLVHAGVAALNAGAVWTGALNGTTGAALGVYRIAGTALSRHPARALAASTVYPNPSRTGEFTLPLTEAATVQVVDVLGREVLSQTSAATQRELKLNLRGQASGVYTLLVQTGAGVARQQLIID